MVETQNNSLVFVDSSTKKKWIFAIHDLVEEYDNRHRRGSILSINKDLVCPEIADYNTNDKNLPISASNYYGNGPTSITKTSNPENDSIHDAGYLMVVNDDEKHEYKLNKNNDNLSGENTLSKIDDIVDDIIYVKNKERIDSFTFTNSGSVLCEENNCITYIIPQIWDVINKPFLYETVLITASKRVINYDIKTNDITLYIIINVLYVQLIDLNSKYTRMFVFYNTHAPFYSVKRHMKILYNIFEDDGDKFVIHEPIKNVFKLKKYNGIYFFDQIMNEHPNTSNKLEYILKGFVCLLLVLIMLALLLRDKKAVKVRQIIRVDKDIQYADGFFNGRKVLLKIYKYDDLRCLNEQFIISILNASCFVKYTYKEKIKKNIYMVIEQYGKSLQDIVEYERSVLVKNGVIKYLSKKFSSSMEVNEDQTFIMSNIDKPVHNISVQAYGVSKKTDCTYPTKTCVDYDLDMQWSMFMNKMLSIFLKIAHVVRILHAKHVAHRNLTFLNIYVQNEDIYLCNFEESLFDDKSESYVINEEHTTDVTTNIRNDQTQPRHDEQSVASRLFSSHCSKSNTSNVSNDNTYHITNQRDKFVLGTENYRAPEIIKHNLFNEPLSIEQCKKADVFSLAIIFHLCLFGEHPFKKDNYSIEDNILHDNYFINDRVKGPLLDLMHHMLKNNCEQRLTIEELERHPVFWNSEKIYNFYATLSDMLENKNEISYKIFCRLERNKNKVFVGSWANKLDSILKNELILHRIYNFNSIKGLLRVIRNKGRHYKELPDEIKCLFKSFPDGFIEYFRFFFPNLLMVCYYSGKVAATEELFGAFYL